MALINVIVPVYKVEPYIHRCVDSILGQSFSDFELILVDDGSPDSCGAICDDYAERDSRIHVIHQKNGGLSAARNTGIGWVFANSDSRWLTFVDSDDWLHPVYLETLLEAAQTHGCRLSACYAYHTAGEDFEEGPVPEAVKATADDYYCGGISGNVGTTAWGKLYARELFATLRYPVGKLHEDEFTTYRAVYEAGTVAVVPMEMYAYFQNTAGIIRSKWNPGRMDGLQALEEQMAFARKNGNERLYNRAFDVYTWFLLDNLQRIRALEAPDEKVRSCRRELQGRLRAILNRGRNRGRYPFNIGNMWVYEEAYPVAPVWDTVHLVSRSLRKLLGK